MKCTSFTCKLYLSISIALFRSVPNRHCVRVYAIYRQLRGELEPSGRKASTLPMYHHVPHTLLIYRMNKMKGNRAAFCKNRTCRASKKNDFGVFSEMNVLLHYSESSR